MPRIKFIDSKIKIERWNTFEHYLFEEAIRELLNENKKPAPRSIFLKITEKYPNFEKTKTQVQTHLQKYKLKHLPPPPFPAEFEGLQPEIKVDEQEFFSQFDFFIDSEALFVDEC